MSNITVQNNNGIANVSQEDINYLKKFLGFGAHGNQVQDGLTERFFRY